MSDTPRTDAAVFLTIGAGYNSVDPNFARELERENAALNETTRKHVAAYYELLEHNAALRKALREIADASGFDNIGKWARNKAKDALRKEAQP